MLECYRMQGFEYEYPAINKALLTFRLKTRTCQELPPLSKLAQQLLESQSGKVKLQNYLRDCIGKRNNLDKAVRPLSHRQCGVLSKF